MKLIDKLKNVFFEEVPEDEDEDEIPQTFAKKVEIPKKTVEISKNEVDAEEEKEFEVDNFTIPKKEESREEPIIKESSKEFPMMFDDDDFLTDRQEEDNKPMVENRDDYQYLKREKRDYGDDDDANNLYQGKKELSYVESVNSRKNMSYTRSYYEEKETKGFRPSPIISPIYGILDKNYRKEEVITKRETKVVTTIHGKPDLDSIRNKAFGSDVEIPKRATQDVKEEKSKEEVKKIYDVNSNKPQVNRVTLEDADEYYNDLGLAYNVDYSDASRSSDNKSSRYNKEKKRSKSVDDNLFDLIDSMYNKEE